MHPAGDDALADALWEACVKDIRRFGVGPFIRSQVDAQFARGRWRLLRRFVGRQAFHGETAQSTTLISATRRAHISEQSWVAGVAKRFFRYQAKLQ